MRELEQKRKIKQILYAPVSLVIFLIILIFMGRAVWSVYDKESLSSTRLERAKNEYSVLQSRHQTLTKNVDFMKTDAGVDAVIRSKFRVVKEGEQIAVIVNRTTTSTETVLVKPSFWQRFIGFFGL